MLITTIFTGCLNFQRMRVYNIPIKYRHQSPGITPSPALWEPHAINTTQCCIIARRYQHQTRVSPSRTPRLLNRSSPRCWAKESRPYQFLKVLKERPIAKPSTNAVSAKRSFQASKTSIHTPSLFIDQGTSSAQWTPAPDCFPLHQT
jgi:hypothetical protein